MSRIDIVKLTPSTPVSGADQRARAGAMTGHSSSMEGGRKTASASAQGIRVEVGSRIEAGQPPVDADRVAEIRAALQDGSYPIVPTEIADALIAARLMMGFEK